MLFCVCVRACLRVYVDSTLSEFVLIPFCMLVIPIRFFFNIVYYLDGFV